MHTETVSILGAGPAGLTAAYELAKRDVRPMVLEKLHKVGGLARTETYKDYYFDIGGHRFFTKLREVQHLWQEILRDDLLKVPRESRIYYKGRFFNYPLNLFNALVVGDIRLIQVKVDQNAGAGGEVLRLLARVYSGDATDLMLVMKLFS